MYIFVVLLLIIKIGQRDTMNRKMLSASLLILVLLVVNACDSNHYLPNNYLVVAQKSTETDAGWQRVVKALQEKHDAEVVYFEDSPREAIPEIRRINPRYVAFVDVPEHIGRDYIIDLHKMSRTIDDDIYADYLFGVITGYDSDAALRMVHESTTPLVVKKAVVDIMEMNSGKWFDEFGFIDDHTPGLWGEKSGFDQPVATDTIAPELYLAKFYDLYKKYDPDLVVTAAHASEDRLEMPFSFASITCKDGVLYTDYQYQSFRTKARDYHYFDGSHEAQPLPESGKRKVYFAVGNCLIGNVNNTKESMAIAWMNGSNAANMIGYVVSTWHGRNGWGGLKYWVTNPGRYNLAEAVYMNQQDFVHQQNEWAPGIMEIEYPFDERGAFRTVTNKLIEAGVDSAAITTDHIGFIFDRDVLAFYGDPQWDVRLQQLPEETDYTVTSKIKGGKYIVTIQTQADFSLERMVGDKFKQEHVLDLPFSYFFPKRVRNPRLAEGQAWDAAVDENFLLIYNPDFKPGQTYEIILDID